MERIKALIDKLYQQKEQGFTASQLLPTVQLLQSEILHLQQKNESPTKSKVAVTMPVNLNFAEEVLRTPQANVILKEEKAGLPQEEKTLLVEYKQPLKVVPDVTPVTFKQPEYFPEQEKATSIVTPESERQPEYFLRKPLVNHEHHGQPKPAVTQSNFYAAFDAVDEAPTLMQHQSKKEINELIADQKESLNDRLKQSNTEVVHVLKDTPIKDLRKGIGINDRFTFVSELFRGDDAMYERSIKTINGFGILSEAEYWINRELKFKLGWNDSKEVVQHFYHLVRRRFA